MEFKMKYKIITDLLPISYTSPRRRSGIKIDSVEFLTAHDTGNLNSTAKENVRYYRDTYNIESASAHLFVDDKEIIMCIPLDEKAWHVLYNKPTDNQLFGCDANDCSIGVELCFFTDKTRSQKAYEKYVWLMAYLMYKYNLSIDKLVGHETLDPENKIDPSNGLKYSGHTYDDLVRDIKQEYINCTIMEVFNMFKDENQIADYAKEAVKKLYDNGIIKGDNESNFKPAEFITRQDLCVVVDKVMRFLSNTYK